MVNDVRKEISAEFKKHRNRTSFLSSISLGSEKEYIIENLSVLLSAGIAVDASFEAIKAEIRSSRLKSTIEEMQYDIGSGFPLWKALTRAEFVPNRVLSLIHIGEESGKLPEYLKIIASHEEKERDFHSKITSALLYPVFVFVLTVVIGLGTAWFTLPRLATVFSNLKIKLPIFTKLLIAFGKFLGAYGIFAIPSLIIIFMAVFYLLFINKKTKKYGQLCSLKFPMINKLIQQVEIARMGYIWGSLLNAGLPIVSALDSLAETTDIFEYKKFYTHLRDKVSEGYSVKKSLGLYKNRNRLIPVTVQQMLISSEESGNFPGMLSRIGEIYESKSDLSMKNLPVILEPVLLVVVWIGVLIIAIAIIMPLYSLIGGLNNAR